MSYKPRKHRKQLSPRPEHSSTRPPLERMLRIHQAIQAGKFPHARNLAAELEVSSKSIYRDLDFMRDRLQLPLAWHPAKRGYHYTQEVSAFPTLQITEGELVALVVAEKALQQYRGTSFEKPLLSAVKKMEQSLPDTISLSLGEIDRTISFRTSAEQILNLDIFEALEKATASCQQLQITYRKPGQTRSELRIIDPYHLANINGEWFLFAYDHLRNDFRTFVPARIKQARQTGNLFQRSQKFSLKERLRASFGVHSGNAQYEVVISFNRHAADFIREKKWHESQYLKELKDGRVELRMRLSSLSEVERWVLSWGGNAIAKQPRELVESVRAAARKILGK